MKNANYYVIPGIKPMYRNIKASVIETETIIKVVCEYFNITLEKLKKQNRYSDVVFARSMLIYFLFKYTTMSKSEIARMLNKDHTSIIHNLRSFQDRIDTEEAVVSKIDEIRTKIVNQY